MKKFWRVGILAALLLPAIAYATTTKDRMTFEGPVTVSGTLTTTGAVTQSGAQSLDNTFVVYSTATMQKVNYAPAESGTDAYTATLSPAPTEYKTGMFVAFAAYTGNTGASTLNVNSLGAKPIVKLNDQALTDQCIEADMIVFSFYDGTSFQLISPCAN